MSNSVENILSELEWALEEPSMANSVEASDGKIVRVDKALWDASRVLRDHSQKTYFKLGVPKTVVDDLLTAHKSGKLPIYALDLLNLLAVTCELELKELTSKCADRLFSDEVFLDMFYPSECSTETVMQCFHVFLSRPVRTAEIYRRELSRIAEHSKNKAEIMSNARDLVKQRLKSLIDIGLDCIPVDFKIRSLPVVIYKRNGKLQTAVLSGKHLTPVNVFGKHFNVENASIENSFYLKYGEYVLYKSGKYMYEKNLRSAKTRVTLFEDCTFLLTRRNHVFVVRKLGNSHSLSLWIDDRRFVEIYRTADAIDEIDFDCEYSFLAMRQYLNILIFKLTGHNLILLDERRVNCKTCVTTGSSCRNDRYSVSMVLYQRELLLIKQDCRPQNVDWHLETYKVRPSDGYLSQKIGIVLEEVTDPRIMRSDTNLFIVESRRLRIVEDHPSYDILRTIANAEQFSALSELAM